MRLLIIFFLSCVFANDPAKGFGSRLIRSRSDIPIEEDLVGYREMDQEIKKDLDHFEAIKQVWDCMILRGHSNNT